MTLASEHFLPLLDGFLRRAGEFPVRFLLDARNPNHLAAEERWSGGLEAHGAVISRH